MKAIFEPRIKIIQDRFVAYCSCGKSVAFANKHSALNMLERGTCRYCNRDYLSQKDLDIGIYKRDDGRWCCLCSGCGIEQAYTRKDHAKQSVLADWQCKKCVASAKGFSNNLPVGNETRLYNKFKKSAYSRGLQWRLSQEEMFTSFCGVCHLTGWHIEISYNNPTASLDRIDSSKGYTPDNIQWVHSMVNMAKNKYNEADFIAMCRAVANRN